MYNQIDSLLSLLEDDFDPKSFATHTIQTQMVGEVLQKLIQGVDELDQELYTQVGHYGHHVHVPWGGKI